MSTRSELHELVNQFTDKRLKCCVTLKTDVDHVPLDGESRYLLETDDATLRAISLTPEQQKKLILLGGKLISLSIKKQKVLKFTSKEHVRTYVFEAYKEFLVTIRNHGSGHLNQIYKITITKP